MVGATAKGVDTMARRALAATGPWTEHAYDSATSGWKQAGRARLYELVGRRLVVVPYPDRTYFARYQLRVLELTAGAVTEQLRLAVPSPGIRSVTTDDLLGGAVIGGRLVLRVPGELIVLEVDARGVRDAGRVAL